MKILILGDIHGRRIWREAVGDPAQWDEIVFMGDYFDPYDSISPEDLIANFEDIKLFKKQYDTKVTLLLGNHDLHYLEYTGTWSRFDRRVKDYVKENILNLIKQKQIHLCRYFDREKILFTHAGLSKMWYTHFFQNNPDTEYDEWSTQVDTWNMSEDEMCGLVEKLNSQLYSLDSTFMSKLGFVSVDRWDIYGTHPTNSPLWIRPQGLCTSRIYITSEDKMPVKGITQVVGHTQMEHVRMVDGVIFVDVLGQNRWTVIQDGVIYEKGTTEFDQPVGRLID